MVNFMRAQEVCGCGSVSMAEKLVGMAASSHATRTDDSIGGRRSCSNLEIHRTDPHATAAEVVQVRAALQ